MAPTFEEFIQSPQFTFFIGQEGKAIVVHAAAIAATSQQLDALINGGMEESETRCARIEDVKVDDFIRFCEYAYRGDYTVPPWEVVQLEPVQPEPSYTCDRDQQSEFDDWGFSRSAKKSKKNKKKGIPSIGWDESTTEPVSIPESDTALLEANYSEDGPCPEPSYEVRPISRAPLRTQFNSRNYLNDDEPKVLISQHFEPKPNSAVDQNFTPVLLAHARLYCFAQLRLIAPLKALTLDKLHRTLMGFRLYEKRVGDIIELARYAYSHPDMPDRSDNGTINDLRKLVVEYIVCEIDTIGKCNEFVKYMEEGGEFVGDFWRMARCYVA